MTGASTEPFEPKPGDVIDGKYRCERIIGEGGMGAVVQATHLLRQAPVALKFMSGTAAAKPELVERFINEAVAASRIDSDHVVKIFDVSRLADGTPYLVMEYLVGEELGALLTREGKPGLESVPRAVHLTLQVLRALQIAHAAGIVHRDMKPANCFVVTRDGEPDFVKVIDFGISKIAQPTDSARLTRTHAMLGTPLYMAPEQVRSARRADERTDLYAAGLILYELLSGRTPFHADENGIAGLFAEVLLGDPTPLASLREGLPEGLVAAVHKALTRDPAGRFANVLEMADALAPHADERSAEVLRGIRRRGRAGVRSSLRPPPGAEAPAIPAAAALPLIKPPSASGTVAEEPLMSSELGRGTTPEPLAALPAEPVSVAGSIASSVALSASSGEAPATQAALHQAGRTAMGDSAAAVSATAAGPAAPRRSILPWLVGAGLLAGAAVTVVALSSAPDDAGPAGPAADAVGGGAPGVTQVASASTAAASSPTAPAVDASALPPPDAGASPTSAPTASTARVAPSMTPRPPPTAPPTAPAPSSPAAPVPTATPLGGWTIEN